MNSNFSLIGLGMRFQIYNGEPEITGTKNRTMGLLLNLVGAVVSEVTEKVCMWDYRV